MKDRQTRQKNASSDVVVSLYYMGSLVGFWISVCSVERDMSLEEVEKIGALSKNKRVKGPVYKACISSGGLGCCVSWQVDSER